MPALDALHARTLLSEDLITPYYHRYMDAWLDSWQDKASEVWSSAPKTPHSMGDALREVGASGGELADDIARHLQMCETYYVDPGMNPLITAAADSMPEEDLLPEDLPTPAGFMLIPGGLSQIDVRGNLLMVDVLHWTVYGSGVTLFFYSDKNNPKDSLDQHIAPEALRNVPRYSLCHMMRIPFHHGIPVTFGPKMLVPPEYGISMQYHQNPDGSLSATLISEKGYSPEELKEIFEYGEHPDPLSKWLIACWRIMQQPITTLTEEEPPRNIRRRMERKNIPNRKVTIIRLRRSASRGDAGSEVEWTHQWLVRGHWRKQWYGSGENRVQRVIWIHPHIKGPEGAPLLVREHVYSLER